MGIPVSHLNNKLRKPLVWRLDGRAPAKFHLYKQDSAQSDTLSIRKDPQLFAMPQHTRDVTSGSVPRATRRLRRKRRQRAVTSRCESSSSDTDERASGVSERDIEVYLTESSLECPANVPLVLSTPCILYQTTPAGVQEELPLQLGLIVTGIFQHQNWVYVQTPHGQEGYVLHKHCLPLCILPAQKVNSSKRGNVRGNVTSWKTSDSILEHIEDLKRPGGKPYDGQFVEALKDYNGGIAEVDGLPHERWDPSLAESEQMLLDWNRNQVMSEDVFDHLNALGEDCVYQNNVERRGPEKWTYRSIRCIDEILADLVGTEKSLTEDVSDNFENTRCESAFTDGGYFMDDIGMGKEIFGILPNEIFGEMQSNCLSSGNSVDQSNVNADCKYGGVAYDHGSQGLRNGVDNTRVEQHQILYGKSKKCGSRAQPANGVPETCRGEGKSNQCVCCFENCSTHQDSKSESSANISKDFKSPRYSSTPLGKPQYNSNICHDVRKTKKHCSTYCAHERVQQIEPSVKVPNKSEDKQRNMDDSKLRFNENLPGKQYHQHEKEDFTSQYSWKPIQKIFPDGSHSCSNENFDSNTSKSTREYKFQTIEILQEPGRKESSTSDCKPGNRIKKPCFKIHNKIEVRTNSAGLLTDIVEDEVDHQVDQNEQNKLDQNHDRCNNGSSLLKNETQINKKSKASPTITCDRYTTNNELINKGSPTVSTRDTFKDSIDSRTFDTLSTASYPLRRKSTKPTSADSISLCSELYIDDFFIRRRSRKKLPRGEPVRHKPLMLITEDYYNADGGFQVLKDEIVVLLNIYKSWLYVQTQKQQNGFIPSYIAAYAVV